MTPLQLVTVPAGEDLMPVLARAPSGAWLQAVGAIEAVELRVASDAGDVSRPLRGRFTLVSLVGPAGGPLTATLARATDAGLELLGGVLVRARSAGVSLAITPPPGAAAHAGPGPSASPAPHGTTVAEPAAPPPAAQPLPPGNMRGPEPRPQQPAAPAVPPGSTHGPGPAAPAAAYPAQPAAQPGPGPQPGPPVETRPAAPAAPPAPPAPPLGAPAPAPTAHAGDRPPMPPGNTPAAPRTWADVVVASDAPAGGAGDDRIDDEEEPVPQQGDLVDHFSFGLCDVLTSDGERLRIRDLKGTSRVREVSIEALRVMPPTRQGDKRLFRLLRKV